MIKEKKCKGQGKAHNFESCLSLVKAESRKYGLCRSCYIKWLTTTENGKEQIGKLAIQVKKDVQKQNKAKDKLNKEKIKNWKNELQPKINKISRLIDLGLPCLAREVYGQIHGGHVYSVGSNQTMRFNLHNIHRQSAHSNRFQNDDGLMREKLQKEYGKEYFDFLFQLRRIPSLKYSNDDYHDFYKKALKIINRLEKSDIQSDLLDRIRLRNEINIELGIYENEYCEFEA